MTDRLDQAQLDELWDFGDPAASEERLRAASATARATQKAELETQVARSLGLQGRFEEADAVLDAIEDAEGVVAVRVALERGRVLNSSGHPLEAVPKFEIALDRAKLIGHDFLTVDAAHMLAIADPENSAAWTDRALATTETTADARTRRWAVSLHNNRGWNLHDAGSYDAALAEFEAALAAALDTGTAEQQHVAKWAVARCLRSLGRVDEALAIQEQLLLDQPDDKYVAEELAELRKQ